MRLVGMPDGSRPGVQRGGCDVCSMQRNYHFVGPKQPAGPLASKSFHAFEKALDRGLDAIEREDWALAEACFEEAVALENWFGPGHLQLGLVALSQEDWPGARAALEKAAGLIPLEPGLHDALCRLWTALGNEEKAARHGWLSLQLDSRLDEDDARR